MKVLIASGGSGGHIFPAVSLAKELEENGVEIIFVASKRRLDRSLLGEAPFRKIFLSANPMPYGFGWGALIFLPKLAMDAATALCILIKEKPDAVVGFGGYTSGAVLLLAAMLQIKTLIHEQNAVPGRTNALLDRFVDTVAVSFRETKKDFGNKNTVFTGNPLRAESLAECREKAIEGFGLDRKKTTVLVMGGSQGAKSLNDLVYRALNLLPEEKKRKLQLLHIAGADNADGIRASYEKSGIAGRVFGFVRNINEAYSACDLAISRAGAAAIFELAAFQKPMVLIPYPSRKNNQRFNAIFFAERKAAIYRDEKKLSDTELKDLITGLMDDPEKRAILSENAGKLSITDGARRLKEIILK